MSERRFTYTAQRAAYLTTVITLAGLMLLESSVVVLCIIGLTAGTLRLVLLGLFALLSLIPVRLFLAPLRTSHRLRQGQLQLRYGTNFQADLPLETIGAAEPVQIRLNLLQPLSPQHDQRQQRISACFSEHGQVLLHLAQPLMLRIKRSGTFKTRSILINVDDREGLLQALGLPRQPQASGQSASRPQAPAVSAGQQLDAPPAAGQAGQPVGLATPAPRLSNQRGAAQIARWTQASAATAISASNLTRRYGDVVAVDQLRLHVQAGEIYGFLGSNGAGKTTTIKLLVGLLEPSAGQACIAGHDVWCDPLQARAALGYVADKALLYERLSGYEFLRFLGQIRAIPHALAERRIDQLLEQLDLSEHAGRPCGSYSFGMKRKLALAGALLHQPPVLVLDEPLNGLDPRSARRLKDLLLEHAGAGTAILLSTHDLASAQALCQRVGILHRGRLLAEGSASELQRLAAAPDLEAVFLSLTEEQKEQAP